MAKEMFFFATGAELLERLKTIESSRPIKYVKCGAYNSQDYLIYNSANEFKNLGVNVSGDHQSESYLIFDFMADVCDYKIKQETGEIKYFINQKNNKESIVFWPGGFYGANH